MFQPRGDVLELACGPGVCTGALAAYASRLNAVDVSPEMLHIASARAPQAHIHFIESDIFSWAVRARLRRRVFSAWLSNVPPQRFEPFWELVGRCLKRDDRVFFLDERPPRQLTSS